jgi:predicted TIM-barrel fold metal-dependent hydrolase
VNFHIGASDIDASRQTNPGAGRHASVASLGPGVALDNANVIANVIMGGVCHRFPELPFVTVESGIGWIPYALENLDWHWLNFGVREEHPEYDLLPSEYFLRQMYANFLFETESVKKTIELLGDDWILYESDYPHPTSMAPGPASVATTPREYIASTLSGLPEDTIRKVLHDNAARLYHLD